MAQAEVLSLVATAVDRATPVLQQVQRSLDLIKRSAGGLEASMAQSRSAVQSYGDAFRGTAANMTGFRTATQQTALALRNAQGQMTGFANTLGREVASSITRVQSAIVSATVSIAAFKNQLQASRELSEFAQATGFSRDMVVGLTHAAQDFGVPAEKMEQMLGQLGQKFQDLKQLGGGDLYKQLVNVPEMRRAAEEMSAVGEQIASNLITQEEGSQKQFEILQRSLRDYREKYSEIETRGMLRRANLPEELANLTRVPWEELKQKADAYAASVRQLDPEQVKKFWEAWHKLSIELSNFTTGVLGPLLPKLSEFMTLFAAPELKKFTETQLPKVMSDLMTAYGELTKFFEGKELDWEKIFNMNAVQEVDARFDYMVALNRRRWLQLKELYGGSSADVAEALKTEAEALAALTKITGPPKPGIVPPVLMPGSVLGPESSIAPTPEDADKRAADLKGAAQRRAEERAARRQQQQPLRFTGGSTIEGRNWTHDLLKDSPMSTNIEDRRGESGGDEKTRATTDLTDEIRKLNANFLRGVGGDFAAGTGGAVKFAPSGGGEDLRTGTGPGGGPPGGTTPGGGPRGGGGGTRRGPTTTVPSPNIPPQPVPVFPRGESKAAGKHLGTAPDATMPAPGAEVPVYGPGEGKAAGKRLGTAPDATMPAPEGGTEGAVYGPQDRSNKSIPASIRYNNPGAQWPSGEESKRFGQTDVGIIGGGNKIAGFPTPVHGLASNIALAHRLYVGKTVGNAIRQWSGGGRSSIPGYDSNAILTKEMVNDPNFWIQMAAEESGKKGGLTPAQIQQALDMHKAGSAGAYEKANPEFVKQYKGRMPTTTAQPAGAATPTAPTAGDGKPGLVSPVTGTFGGHPDSPYGAGRDDGGRKHSGVDWQAADNSDAVAMQDGTVLYTGHNKGYQHNIVIKHADGTITRYATHGPLANLKVGDTVKQGQTVGKIDRRHLHLEHIPQFLADGKTINPKWQEFHDNAKSNTFTSTSHQKGTVDPRQYTNLPYKAPVKAGAPLNPDAPATASRDAPPDPYYARRAAKAKEAASTDAPDTGGSKAAGKNLGPATAAAADDDKVDGLQAGGSANKGKPYIVGEGGPELFMPFQSGMVLPNMATKYLKGLQIGGKSLGEYFSMAQSPGRLLSSVFGGGSPLSQLLGGGGGGGEGGGGNPLSSLMSGLGGGEGGNPLSGFMGFQEGGIIPEQTRELLRTPGTKKLAPSYQEWETIPPKSGAGTFQDLRSREFEMEKELFKNSLEPGSLRNDYSGQAQKIQASGNIDINIGSTGNAAIAKSEKSGLFENINMNRNLAEQHSSQRM